MARFEPSSADNRDVDRQLLGKLWRKLGKSHAYEFVRDQDFRGLYSPDLAKPWFDLRHDLSRPEVEFFDLELEKLKGALLSANQVFLLKLYTYTGPLDRTTLHGFHPDLKNYNYGLYLTQGVELNELSTALAKAYEDLIREGRRRLKVGIDDLERIDSSGGTTSSPDPSDR